jgi:hypothetical protein
VRLSSEGHHPLIEWKPRQSPFHGGNGDSNPPGDANRNNRLGEGASDLSNGCPISEDGQRWTFALGVTLDAEHPGKNDAAVALAAGFFLSLIVGAAPLMRRSPCHTSNRATVEASVDHAAGD